jgi:hypothetical protein
VTQGPTIETGSDFGGRDSERVGDAGGRCSRVAFERPVCSRFRATRLKSHFPARSPRQSRLWSLGSRGLDNVNSHSIFAHDSVETHEWIR